MTCAFGKGGASALELPPPRKPQHNLMLNTLSLPAILVLDVKMVAVTLLLNLLLIIIKSNTVFQTVWLIKKSSLRKITNQKIVGKKNSKASKSLCKRRR